mmetsp:Transcript_29317/g.61339  ORF Transcript_29317/g.61339 Transcript_29317/m.61339 type:complete len:136 (+) Transcript_29317:1071-1478(+)
MSNRNEKAEQPHKREPSVQSTPQLTAYKCSLIKSSNLTVELLFWSKWSGKSRPKHAVSTVNRNTLCQPCEMELASCTAGRVITAVPNPQVQDDKSRVICVESQSRTVVSLSCDATGDCAKSLSFCVVVGLCFGKR